MTRKHIIIFGVCWCVMLAVILGWFRLSYAGDATFSWLPNSETDLAGYKVYYGAVSRTYSTTIDVGLPEISEGRVVYAVKDIPQGTTYYAVTAYDTSGLESDYSVEVEYNPPPAPPADPVIFFLPNGKKVTLTVE